MDQEKPVNQIKEELGGSENGKMEPNNSVHKKNIYPSLRHIILTSFILMCMALILFLMLQNGKSIYDNGL